MTRQRWVDLFGGAGGTHRGLELAGCEVVSVEWWDQACAVQRAAGHDVMQADVRSDEWVEHLAARSFRPLGAWASPPCQAFSTAGNRLGPADERNGWPWTWGAIDRMRAAGIGPEWLICENVEGMLHHVKRSGCERGRFPNPETCGACYFHGVILPELRARFACVSWRRLDAADYGVPQNRIRVIIACGPSAFPWPNPTHAPAGSLVGSVWRDGGAAIGMSPTGRPALTITAGCGDEVPRSRQGNARIIGRRLTVTECGVLQDFPADWPWQAARTVEDRYKCAGNAVPPRLATALVSQLRQRVEVAA